MFIEGYKMKKILLKICSLALVVIAVAAIAPVTAAKALEIDAKGTDEISVSNARAAMLLDYDTGSVIYEYNQLNRQPIASFGVRTRRFGTARL